MKYQLKTRVYSNAFSKMPTVVNDGEFEITFITETPDEEVLKTLKLKNWIVISVKIEDYEEYLPKFKVNAGGPGKHSLDIRSPKIRKNMIDILHYIESMGGFWLDIKSIDINALEEEWVPESEEEKKQLSVMNLNFKKSYLKMPTEITSDVLSKILSKKAEFEYLVVPLKFYLAGKESFESLNYYAAYLNFFLFIESIFSKGFFRTQKLKKAFREQSILLDAINLVIEFLNNDGNIEKRKELESFFNNVGKKIDNREDIIDFLIDMRGNLAHFPMKRKNQPIDLKDQSKFQPVAFLISSVAIYVVAQLANDSSLFDQIKL